jgi:outer membrane protein insertion porin family
MNRMHVSRYSSTTFTAFLLALGAILGHSNAAQAKLFPAVEATPDEAETVSLSLQTEAIATTEAPVLFDKDLASFEGEASSDLNPVIPPASTPDLEATTTDRSEPQIGTFPQPSDSVPQIQNARLLSETEVTSTTATDLLRETPASTTPVRLDEYNPELLAQLPDISQGNALSFRLDSGTEFPTALISSMRPRVIRLPIKRTGLAAVVSLRQPLSGNSYVNLGIEGGERIAAFDLGVVFEQESDPRQGLGVNFFNQRSFHPAFSEGDPEVDLPDGNTPRIHRLGGGLEYFLPLGDVFESAFGITYERVSVRDDLFTSDVETIDEFGNQLVADEDGIDDILTLSAAFEHDRRDVVPFPTSGSHLRLGIDQSFNLGSNDITYTRLNAFFTQYIPLDLFGFTAGPRTLIFNVQTGTMFGDVPPYAAFNLGGQNSIRGYNGGEVGTGTSFIQASLEYRFPIFDLTLFQQEIPIQGVLFVDYGTDFDTGDEVIGEPAEVRNKPGDGLGYGIGLQTRGPFGFLGRLEFAINDEGDTDVIATVGDRF